MKNCMKTIILTSVILLAAGAGDAWRVQAADQRLPFAGGLYAETQYEEEDLSAGKDSAEVWAAKKKLRGWVTKKRKTYYYVDGEPVSGWRRIRKKWYFFDEETKALVKNRITGNKEGGFYYVDAEGIRVTDQVVQMAVEVARANTTEDMTKLEKLYACYQYFVKKCRYRSYHDGESSTKMSSFARDMFKNRQGNCYRGAAALAYCARVLGFETRVGIGGVTSHARGRLYDHGWMEQKGTNDWYMYDISMGRRTTRKLYHVTRKKYPYRLRKDKAYTLIITDGKPHWEQLP